MLRQRHYQSTTLTLAAVFLFAAKVTFAADASEWKRFDIKGAQLGMSLKQALAIGFKGCEMPPGWTKVGLPFYKILDKRCDKGSGNKCTVESKGDTCNVYFNGQRASADVADPLEYMVVLATTETDEPRVYNMTYYFPRALIRNDSPLGKALVAKYGSYCNWDLCYDTGETDSVGGGLMLFQKTRGEPPALQVDCRAGQLHIRQCIMQTDDPSIIDADRSRQAEKNEAKVRKSQGAPPTF